MRNADNESSEVGMDRVFVNFTKYLELDETIIKQGLAQLKGAEALFLDRLRNENEEEVIDDLHRLNYALAFIHRYVGEEDVALEYCRNVDGYLLGKYPQGHSKLDRFYGMFPHYHENAPREEDEEEDEDVSQEDEDEGGVSGQEESANRYENGENGEEIEGREDEGEGEEGEESGQYQGQEESGQDQGQEESGQYQGQEESGQDQGEQEGEGQYEGEGEQEEPQGQTEEAEEPQGQTEEAEEPEGQIEGEVEGEQQQEQGEGEGEGESGEPAAVEQSGGNDASQDQ